MTFLVTFFIIKFIWEVIMKAPILFVLVAVMLCTAVGQSLAEDYTRYQLSPSERQQIFDAHRSWWTGKVYDPLTGKEIASPTDSDMGHKPGQEFWRLKEDAQKRGITREQFIQEQKNIKLYRPELPSSNRSHLLESKVTKTVGKNIVKMTAKRALAVPLSVIPVAGPVLVASAAGIEAGITLADPDRVPIIPNVKMPTMGGHLWWNTLETRNGYKLQQNKVFKNARILDENDYRVDYGGINSMRERLNEIAGY
jgi:hypothetical protein